MRRKNLKSQNSNIKASKIVLILLIVILGIVTCYLFVKELSTSLFFKKKDRVNIVFYGKETVYYSLGTSDGVNYFISFYPDIKVKVPGSYGNYRVGALGKLISLQNQSDILRKTFSVTTASTVDRYFFNDDKDIFYGKELMDGDNLKLPDWPDMFFTRSNSNLFDRVFTALQFFGKQKNQFTEINYKSVIGDNEEFFQDKDFAKKYQGFLYNQIYRKEQKTVQILYGDSYKTALFLSKIIEGDGIRVVDLTQEEVKAKGACRVIEGGSVFSQSSKDISRFLHCALLHGQTESSDIIIQLGNAEKEWEIL